VRLAAQRLDRLARRHLRPQHRVLAGHHRAGGAGRVGGELADVLALGGGERGGERGARLLVEPGPEIGPLVRVHRRDQRGQLARWCHLGDRHLGAGVEIAEGLRAAGKR